MTFIICFVTDNVNLQDRWDYRTASYARTFAFAVCEYDLPTQLILPNLLSLSRGMCCLKEDYSCLILASQILVFDCSCVLVLGHLHELINKTCMLSELFYNRPDICYYAYNSLSHIDSRDRVLLLKCHEQWISAAKKKWAKLGLSTPQVFGVACSSFTVRVST